MFFRVANRESIVGNEEEDDCSNSNSPRFPLERGLIPYPLTLFARFGSAEKMLEPDRTGRTGIQEYFTALSSKQVSAGASGRSLISHSHHGKHLAL